MSDVAIRLENLGKLYHLTGPAPRYKTLRDTLSGIFREALFDRKARRISREQQALWALREVSFDVPHGSILGLIGRNGAGKTTLLKILARVTPPTEGYGEINGRIGSLLQVGTGFHHELTGRENIFLSGAILGMRRAEILHRFDEIVDFAEIGPFLDTPVKRYSSGMYMRLAFAIAAHLEPEILLVDEVLAVGDAEFQRKCIGKMGEVAKKGRTVLFVSHNMSAILRLTQEAVVLDQGRVVLSAPTCEAVDFYLSQKVTGKGEYRWVVDQKTGSPAPFIPLALRICNKLGQTVDVVRSVESFFVEVEYHLTAATSGLRVGIRLQSIHGELILFSFDMDDLGLFESSSLRRPGHYLTRCEIPGDLLNEGRFVMGLSASAYRMKPYVEEEHVLTFTVDGAGAPGGQWAEHRAGLLRPRLKWQIEAIE
jgi:lipopolysaccharide transport system ATP-binding protein